MLSPYIKSCLVAVTSICSFSGHPFHVFNIFHNAFEVTLVMKIRLMLFLLYFLGKERNSILTGLLRPAYSTSALSNEHFHSIKFQFLDSSRLRLRGGMGIFGTTNPTYCEQYDSNPLNCRCPPGCRCDHCKERTGFNKILKARYLDINNISSLDRCPHSPPSGL